MIDGPRPHNGGDDDKEKFKVPGNLRKVDAERVEVPAEVSPRELRFYLLQQTLKQAVEEEEYKKAKKVKKELDSIRARLMKKLENKGKSCETSALGCFCMEKIRGH